ncbi:MAG: hypothetical protein KDA84_18860 [Planctomycetaceae bacterium]|nr:hypothetical protein [Planctomycetaceae bacterium]
MRTFLLSNLTVSLMLTAACSPLFAEGETPKAAPMKQVPTEGTFEIKVTTGDREHTYSHPSKALTDIGRAVARAKRAKEGETVDFEAELTLNDQVFTFTNPEAAFEACRTLTNAMRELPKMRMGLGDLGEIPEVKKEEQPAADAGNQPMTAKSRAAAVAEVRRRINLALRKQMAGSGRSGRPSMPNPMTMQRTIQQEIEKARQEGLLPSANQPNNPGGGFAGGDPREAKKEAIVQTLGLVLSQADSVGKSGEKPKESESKAAGSESKETKAEDSKAAESSEEKAAEK